MIDIDTLEKLAFLASSGWRPWRLDPNARRHVRSGLSTIGSFNLSDAHAEYAVAAQPDHILELVAEMRSTRDERDGAIRREMLARERLVAFLAECGVARKALENERDALLAKIKAMDEAARDDAWERSERDDRSDS